MKTTPGPWTTKPENNYVPAQVWAEGRQIAEVYGEDRETRRGNARLMAMSPELYEAGDRMLGALADYFLDCGLDVLAERLRRHASVPTTSKADVIEAMKLAADNLAEVMRRAKGE